MNELLSDPFWHLTCSVGITTFHLLSLFIIIVGKFVNEPVLAGVVIIGVIVDAVHALTLPVGLARKPDCQNVRFADTNRAGDRRRRELKARRKRPSLCPVCCGQVVRRADRQTNRSTPGRAGSAGRNNNNKSRRSARVGRRYTPTY
ncbi:hypothetical protein PoB_000124700 [Plakobranchus ocellatus]|uniref:Uncharacterized protein n=1 Tax=Plakobranchus ocellatus TaxID=259542 RepID=A0AAV3XX70_9GAST|nr:hypothetical protein PoB_000124700 [Plakobranchus ocellatus]